MVSLAKQAGAAEAVRQFFRDSVSAVPATGAAGLAQKLFSTRVKPSDTRLFSRVNFLDGVRSAVFGNPINMYRELDRYGRTPSGHSLPLALKRYYYRSVVPPGSWRHKSLGSKALSALVLGTNVAIPALEVAGAAVSPKENRGEAIGRAAASIAAAPFSSRLGIAGSFASAGAAHAGGAIGKLFDPKAPELRAEEANAVPQRMTTTL